MELNLTQQFLTENDCYRAGRTITPKGVMVHSTGLAKGEEGTAQDMLRQTFEYYRRDPDQRPPDFQTIPGEEGTERAVCDYIAGMTDPFAVERFKELFIPKGWTVL